MTGRQACTGNAPLLSYGTFTRIYPDRIYPELPSRRRALAEFARVTLSKLSPPLAPEVVYEQVRLFEETFEILPLSPAVVLEAVRGHSDHSFSYFDAQIWAAARPGQIPVILSEGFSPGSVVEDVSPLNPLAGSVDLAEL